MRIKLKITRRNVLIAIGLWLGVILASLGITALRLHISNLRELREAFARWRSPEAHRRIVVFAPHCDDETIAAGGLIRQATVNGAEVWVVMLTNGDGFKAATAINNRSLRLTPADFIRMGYKRQDETLAALRRLGVKKDHVIFLGYPDRGIEPMWMDHWTRPTKSDFTLCDHSPYFNACTRNAAYTGHQLCKDIEGLLTKIKPDQVYMPHPDDQHCDHWATSAFVMTALYNTGQDDKLDSPALYLVHRGDWPVPQGLHPDARLAPPAALDNGDTDWRQFPLDEQTINAKKLAIGEYRSQTAGTQRFIRSFVKENELFGLREMRYPLPVCQEMKIDGSVEDWDGIVPVIPDPADDGIPAHARPSADLTGIWAASDGHQLYTRISVRGKVARGTKYELRIRRMGRDEGTTAIVVEPGKPAPKGWKVAFRDNTVELSCPLSKWDSSPMMICAATRTRWYGIPSYFIDRSAYRILSTQQTIEDGNRVARVPGSGAGG